MSCSRLAWATLERSLWRSVVSGMLVLHLLCAICFDHLQCALSLKQQYCVAGSFLPFLESTLLAVLLLTFSATVSEFALSKLDLWGWLLLLHTVHAKTLMCAMRVLNNRLSLFVAQKDPVAVDVFCHVRLLLVWAPLVLWWTAQGVPLYQ